MLVSTITVRVDARWESLPTGVLGTTFPDSVVRNFANAPRPNIDYPVALAEALAGSELNGSTRKDIIV